MREELVENLARACAELIRQVDPQNGLLPKLLSSGVLTWEQVDRCKAKETSSDKVEEVLSCLRRCPDGSYVKFCDVLKKLGQGELVDQYLQPARVIPETPSTSSCSQDSPGSELRTTRKRKAGRRDKQHSTKKIKAEKEVQETSSRRRERQARDVVTRNTPQKKMKAEEEKKEMTRFQEAFRKKRKKLCEKLDFKHGLLTALRDEGVLTKEQIEEINQPMKTRLQSIEALLDILEERPDDDFEKFCKCLDKTNQIHIAELLRQP
jgi:flagellar biosynthesis GTPase FlhF